MHLNRAGEMPALLRPRQLRGWKTLRIGFNH
jgi:hypothetical protein